MNTQHKIKKVLWGALFLLIVAVFFVAMQKKQTSFSTGIDIEIINQAEKSYVNKVQIENLIKATYDLEKTSIKKIDIQAIEKVIENNVWVNNANLFFDAQLKLRVKIEQRIPIARIFAVDGISNFLDSSGKRLPLTSASIARVLVVTGFPNSNPVLSHSDSMLLSQVKNVCNAIVQDSLLQVQIAQLHINLTGNFELSTVLGNQKILFGNDTQIEEKCKKIKIFYSKVFSQFGEDRYNLVDVRFKDQIVGTLSNYVQKGLISDSLNRYKDTLPITNNLQIDSTL